MRKQILIVCVLLLIGAFMCPSAFGGLGYWDLFSVTLTPNGQYWTLVNGGTGPLSDPLESPDCAGVAIIDNATPLGGTGWFFGGYDWGTGTLEGNAGKYAIKLNGASSYTLNVILDTKTTPASNGLYGSWGTVKNIRVRPWVAGTWGIAIPVVWVISPYSPPGGTTVTQNAAGDISEIKLGVLDFGDTEFNGQAQGIYGASAQLPYAAGYCVEFVTDLKTWDSYDLTTAIPNPAPTGDCNCPTGQPAKIKWSQEPDLTVMGFDVDATNFVLADDFECNSPKPITDFHIWGSWMWDYLPFGYWYCPNMGNPTAVKFTLSIHSNKPYGPYGWSEPNQLLWKKVFSQGEFTAEPYFASEYELEGWYHPYGDEFYWYSDMVCWKYNFYVNKKDAFWQLGDPCHPVIYWLNVKADPCDPNAQFGWKTSKEHWQDDAVWGWSDFAPWYELIYPPPHPQHPNSIDLAFEITTSGDPNNPYPVADLGDAPDSTNTLGFNMTTYPVIVNAKFPTVYVVGSPPPGPIHWQPTVMAYLGPMVSTELEADVGPDQDGLNNISPNSNASNKDGNDDGVLNIPLNLPYCQYTSFNYLVNVINPNFGKLYVNVWFDWNRDGDWDDTLMCGSKQVPEWAVQNQVFFNLPAGLNQITTPGFLSWHPDPNNSQPIWMRITLAEQPWTGTTYAGMVGNGGSGIPGGYQYGETEDYYFTPDISCQYCKCYQCCLGDLNKDKIVNFADLAIFANNWLKSIP